MNFSLRTDKYNVAVFVVWVVMVIIAAAALIICVTVVCIGFLCLRK